MFTRLEEEEEKKRRRRRWWWWWYNILSTLNPYLAPGEAISVDLNIKYIQLNIPTQTVLIKADRNIPAAVFEIPHDAGTQNHGYFTIKV